MQARQTNTESQRVLRALSANDTLPECHSVAVHCEHQGLPAFGARAMAAIATCLKVSEVKAGRITRMYTVCQLASLAKVFSLHCTAAYVTHVYKFSTFTASMHRYVPQHRCRYPTPCGRRRRGL